MSNHVITVQVKLKSNGTVDPASWKFLDDSPELRKKKEAVFWVLKAKDHQDNDVPAKELCFAIPSHGKVWGVEVKAVDPGRSGNGWLTVADVNGLNANLRARQPEPDFPMDPFPQEFRWDVKPKRIMKGVRKRMGREFHCCQWVRVVDAAGNVSQKDPEVRFRSQF